MTDFAYGFRRRTTPAELDGLALEKLDRNVEARDVDNDVGAYAARGRRAYVNVAEGELITRDVQHRSVSLGEVAEGEPAAIVSNAIFEAGDDWHAPPLRPGRPLGGPLGRGPGEGERRASRARVPGHLRRRLSLLRVDRAGRLRPGRGGSCRPCEPRVRRRAGGEGHTRRVGR